MAGRGCKGSAAIRRTSPSRRPARALRPAISPASARAGWATPSSDSADREASTPAAPRDSRLPRLDDSQQLTGLDKPEAIGDFYLKQGAPLVALKMGAEGALLATPQRRVRIAPHKVELVDATGAGDTFDGAFLARLLAGDDIEAAARYANVAAALSTQGYGAVTPIPRKDEAMAAMKRPNPLTC